MKTTRFFLPLALILALASLSSATFGADDIAEIVEKKGPPAKEVIADTTLFRESKLPRLPVNVRQVEFLLDHPLVSLALARLYATFLDLYRMDVQPDGVIHIYDPGGLEGNAELIYSRPGKRVYFIAGYFDVFTIRFNGRMVLVAEYPEGAGDEAVSVDAKATTYIKVDSAIAGMFARLMDMLFPKKVDQRIERFTRAARNISSAVHRDPAEAYLKLKDSGDLSPGELEEFARLFPGKAAQGEGNGAKPEQDTAMPEH